MQDSDEVVVPRPVMGALAALCLCLVTIVFVAMFAQSCRAPASDWQPQPEATRSNGLIASVWLREGRLYFHNADGSDRLLGCLRDDDGRLTLEDCR